MNIRMIIMLYLATIKTFVATIRRDSTRRSLTRFDRVQAIQGFGQRTSEQF
jgi:hypothetical protein